MSLSETFDVFTSLDSSLRDQVRRAGVDPQRDRSSLRRLAEQVVADHDRRSLTGAVSPVADPAAVVEEMVANLAGFGPLQRYLDDPGVEEIWINDPSRVFVARRGRHELTSTILTRAQVDELVERMLTSSGRRVDVSQPFVDALLPGGHRLHVVLEGIAHGFCAVNIRKFVARAARLHDLVGLGSLTEPAAAFLDAAVAAGINIVVSGGTQANRRQVRLLGVVPRRRTLRTPSLMLTLRPDSTPDWWSLANSRERRHRNRRGSPRQLLDLLEWPTSTRLGGSCEAPM